MCSLPRVGEHRQAVVFGTVGCLIGAVGPGSPPADWARVRFRGKVFFLHCSNRLETSRRLYRRTCRAARTGRVPCGPAGYPAQAGNTAVHGCRLPITPKRHHENAASAHPACPFPARASCPPWPPSRRAAVKQIGLELAAISRWPRSRPAARTVHVPPSYSTGRQRPCALRDTLRRATTLKSPSAGRHDHHVGH